MTQPLSDLPVKNNLNAFCLSNTVDELEERGGDHLGREHGTLFAAGKEHRDKSVLGGKDVS